MKRSNLMVCGAALVALMVMMVWAQDPGSNYRKAGGTRWVIGGSLDFTTGTLNMDSGSKIMIAETTVTASAAELNILDGCTATYVELNKLAGVTAGAVTASKALVVGASSQLNALTITTPAFGSTEGPTPKILSMGAGVLASGQATTTVAVTGCVSTSYVFVALLTNQTTAVLKSVVPGTGSFVVTLSTTANTDCRICWQVWK